MVTNFLPHTVGKAVSRLLEDIGTPRALGVSLLLEAGEWDQLASLRVDPKHYFSSESYWRDASATELLRKAVDLPTSFDRKVVAEEGFLRSEGQCMRSNRRLFAYLCPGQPDTDERVSHYFSEVRKEISRILGPVPEFLDGRHGPGATYADKGMLTTIPDKMSSSPTLTPDAIYHLLPWSGTHWSKSCAALGRSPSFVAGNRFTTVPKDACKDRGIAVEPSINVFYQLAYGRVLRRRLKDIGINLEKGQDIHRRIACEASISGHLATLDLSNASDTICRNLVKLLLPARWFEVLDDLRSKKTNFRNNWHLLEKFSSMGNGFTFELETLIFLGILLGLNHGLSSKMTPGENLFVYGDDIIFPTDNSKAVIAALEFCGLSVNKEKTFVDGRFRESCGGDFFDGVDVRPHYLKDTPNEPQQLISLANGLSRLCRGNPFRRDTVNRAWLAVLDGLPSPIRRLRGPEVLGDIVIHDSDQFRWQTRWRSSIRYIRVYRPARFRKVSLQNFAPECILATLLYAGRLDPRGVTPRDAVTGHKIGWVARS